RMLDVFGFDRLTWVRGEWVGQDHLARGRRKPIVRPAEPLHRDRPRRGLGGWRGRAGTDDEGSQAGQAEQQQQCMPDWASHGQHPFSKGRSGQDTHPVAPGKLKSAETCNLFNKMKRTMPGGSAGSFIRSIRARSWTATAT